MPRLRSWAGLCKRPGSFPKVEGRPGRPVNARHGAAGPQEARKLNFQAAPRTGHVINYLESVQAILRLWSTWFPPNVRKSS